MVFRFFGRGVDTSWSRVLLQEWIVSRDNSIKHLDLCLTLADEVDGTAVKLTACNTASMRQVSAHYIMSLDCLLILYEERKMVLVKKKLFDISVVFA